MSRPLTFLIASLKGMGVEGNRSGCNESGLELRNSHNNGFRCMHQAMSPGVEFGRVQSPAESTSAQVATQLKPQPPALGLNSVAVLTMERAGGRPAGVQAAQLAAQLAAAAEDVELKRHQRNPFGEKYVKLATSAFGGQQVRSTGAPACCSSGI